MIVKSIREDVNALGETYNRVYIEVNNNNQHDIVEIHCGESTQLGLGSCPCDDHEAFTKVPCSMGLLAASGVDLPAWAALEQTCYIRGITIGDIAKYCQMSLLLQIPILPGLSQALPGMDIVVQEKHPEKMISRNPPHKRNMVFIEYEVHKGRPIEVVIHTGDKNGDGTVLVYTLK